MNELSLYILDITQNSIKADSTNLTLKIIEDYNNNLLTIKFIDDGKGMSEEVLNKVCDPFFTTRTTRKVGLGLPLYKELCELCGGSLQIESIVGVGTTVISTFKLDSIDLPPLGNICDTLYVLVTNPENCEINFEYVVNEKRFSFSTIEIKEILNGIPITNIEVTNWFKEYVSMGIEELKKDNKD